MRFAFEIAEPSTTFHVEESLYHKTGTDTSAKLLSITVPEIVIVLFTREPFDGTIFATGTSGAVLSNVNVPASLSTLIFPAKSFTRIYNV